jgi:purine-nucleoside/S-methyl-5'-thioadenosine phosphorylase / adenosine deaminase
MTQQTNNLWLWADWPAPKGVYAGTSLRIGGLSKTPYSELNLANHVGDNPVDVTKNRSALLDHLKLSSNPHWLNQTHSTDIISIDGVPENQDADGSFTTTKNRICTILTADCVPILLCNKDGSQIAAIHAGWKGISTGIIENAIKLFTKPNEILVWIGPCICSEHYEVGKDVYESCSNHSDLVKNAFNRTSIDRWHCNLAEIVKILLKNKGVGAIYECNLCTYKLDEMFFSYRRDGITGRTASMIWME